MYRGVWPQNVSRLAKYGLRFVDGVWKVTVLYDAGDGLRFLAVEGGSANIIEQINAVKVALGNPPGGAFYVNEYRHIVVPVKGDSDSGTGSHYYGAGRLHTDLVFDFEGKTLTTRPVRQDGSPLHPGEKWVGPRPGVPYVLSAGGGDVYYETPALTDAEPPEIRPRMIRKVQLSKVLNDAGATARAATTVAGVRGHQGGRFYVNEHGAAFTPVGAGDGNGLDYIYCGQIDRRYWFPEPPLQ